MNEQIYILLAQEGGPGGLFDIGATLPLVALQFLVLMFILNSILYNPLITLMNQRNEYILDNLSKASASDFIILLDMFNSILRM